MEPFFLLVAFLVQSAGPTQECSVTGHVSNAVTNAPIRKANVRLAGPAVNQRLSDSVGTTDDAGAFHFDLLSPNKFSLTVNRTGFLESIASEVNCGAGDVAIKLTPQGMIYGRVVDDEGDPVSGANVMIYRKAWNRGERQFQNVQSSQSQADGTFVIGNLPAGSYYASAKSSRRSPPGESFIDNYFPNTPDPQSAAPISVVAGGEVRGIDLRIRGTRVFQVSGKITLPPGAPPGMTIPLMLFNEGMQNRGQMVFTRIQESLFAFENVPPGSYIINALPSKNGDNGQSSTLTAHYPVTVGDADVEGLELVLSAGAEIPGVILLDGEQFTQEVGVVLQARGGIGHSAAQAKDGAFTLHNVARAFYEVKVQGGLDGYYIKSIRLDGRDLPRHECDLTSGAGGRLELLLSAKPAMITGSVTNADGNLQQEATVNLWTKDDPEIRTVRTRSDGQFTIKNLPPGEYRVIAWESLDRGIIDNPAFRTAFESTATTVTVQEGAAQNVALKMVPKSTTDAELAKLP